MKPKAETLIAWVLLILLALAVFWWGGTMARFEYQSDRRAGFRG